jgi:hypothetical protein
VIESPLSASSACFVFSGSFLSSVCPSKMLFANTLTSTDSEMICCVRIYPHFATINILIIVAIQINNGFNRFNEFALRVMTACHSAIPSPVSQNFVAKLLLI